MKRPQLMIEAFFQVAEADPKAHFLVIGPDQDGSGKDMSERARQLGLSGRVHFTGLLGEKDLLQAYVDADLLVLTSHRENFGMVLVEGMAAGLPVLVSEEVGLAKVIQESGAGLVVPATPESVSREWSRLLNNPELRQQMGMNGRSLVEERFSDEIVVQKMRELFRSVIGQRENA